jgi:transcriptional regulator with XRE-family HTH domain
MLAQAADLDRTYISAVEHGKQNLTLAAVMRLAEALDVPFEQLLVSEDGELLERS